MSRYYFNIYDGHAESFDHDGLECAGIREVRLHMLNVAMEEVTSPKPATKTWSIEAIDDRGVIVGSMDFGLLSSTDYRT